jgi:hypothetical protein
MAEKIEMFAGWDWDGSAIVGRERNIYIDKECTVVVHDGNTERVFTESEVKATIREMVMECGVFISRNGDVNATDIADIKHIAQNRLGIVLDPA